MLDSENQISVIPPRAAELLDMSISGLAKMRMRGDGPRYVKIGRRKIVYRISALNEWLASREVKSTGDRNRKAATR